MVFKYIDYDEMVGSRIRMSKDIDLSNILISTVHFAPAYQLQRNGY